MPDLPCVLCGGNHNNLPCPMKPGPIPGLGWPSSVPQGWQCPVCRKVHAPSVLGCDCHRGGQPPA